MLNVDGDFWSEKSGSRVDNKQAVVLLRTAKKSHHKTYVAIVRVRMRREGKGKGKGKRVGMMQ